MRGLIPAAARFALALTFTPVRAAGGGGGGGDGGGDERVVSDADYLAAMVAVKASDWTQVIKRMSA